MLGVSLYLIAEAVGLIEQKIVFFFFVFSYFRAFVINSFYCDSVKKFYVLFFTSIYRRT